MKTRLRLFAALFLLLPLCAGVLAERPAHAGDEAIPAARTRVEDSARRAGTAGVRAEKWAAEREGLLDEARQLLYDTEADRFAVARQEAYIARERADIKELGERTDAALATRRDLDRVMETLYAALVRARDRDLPFAEDERRARLAALRRTLDDPDAPSGEKLGRLLEALRMEAGYSLDVEAEDAVMQVRGAPMAVTVLRAGRLALLRMPASGAWVERFEPASAEWVELPGADGRELVKAVQIARKQRIAELIYLPVGHGAQPTESQSAAQTAQTGEAQ
ncbi:hypothetical protein DND132_1417 [Pseudodesulfovibrio mercurii]|uniref:DUF3450 domain-containing protein n=1 Tax=Pseudodesulfovibrio mercurii TaxID=641491 RepID=F0JDU3_9BACT|nr:DUF3450 family protein [Pseudodesulfovibrio mercurii]EGB14625.1 hypothetical protein DND132_1417 [Pseudodesulfovibrio mercurii]